MNRASAIVVLLALSSCGLRIGTDPQGASSETEVSIPSIATWSRDLGDSTVVIRRDTLRLDRYDSIAITVPESTFVSVVSIDGAHGAWLRSGERSSPRRQPSALRLRWRDESMREGWAFSLPGTGTDLALDARDGSWRTESVLVFADAWPVRITRTLEGRRRIWWIDSARLADSLVFDLSTFPDSSCPIQPKADGSHWECRPR